MLPSSSQKSFLMATSLPSKRPRYTAPKPPVPRHSFCVSSLYAICSWSSNFRAASVGADTLGTGACAGWPCGAPGAAVHWRCTGGPADWSNDAAVVAWLPAPSGVVDGSPLLLTLVAGWAPCARPAAALGDAAGGGPGPPGAPWTDDALSRRSNSSPLAIRWTSCHACEAFTSRSEIERSWFTRPSHSPLTITSFPLLQILLKLLWLFRASASW
mmetsp:Transcript_85776/g.243291  ORF Transcript_85776/g.243291 Transcript_85776/m.243291 type:complete len:214 (+) Transcript_85776:908-1549(+)